jgi:hypothetical protein
MSAVCPACGVAVVPGYIRCPKCHAGLSLGAGRTKRSTADPGGTAVPARGFPVSAVLIAVAVAAVIFVVFGSRGGTTRKTEAAPEETPEPVEVVSAIPAPRAPRAPIAAPAPPPAAPDRPADDPRAAGLALEDTLRRQRLWGRVEITGQRIDVRSGSCSDKAMRPAIDGAVAVLHGAGLTRLRCLEQSGAVVFERDL